MSGAPYKNRVKLNSLADLTSLAPPSWLVTDFIPSNSLITLYGAPGCGKSFLALDMGLCIATGDDWKGHAVSQGAVVYIAMEGISGMQRRVDAWRISRGITSLEAPFYYTTGFTDLVSRESTDDLLRAIEHDLPTEVRVALVILDTLSRTLGASNENDAGEMNNALNQLDRIKEKTGATIMIVHHTAKHTQQERGSTVLRGACDTMLYLRNDGSSRKLSLAVDKQRDWETPEPMPLWFEVVPAAKSAVLVHLMPLGATALSARDMTLLTALEDAYLGSPVGLTTWKEACGDISETTFRRVVKQLIDEGLVVKGSGKRGGYIPISAIKGGE